MSTASIRLRDIIRDERPGYTFQIGYCLEIDVDLTLEFSSGLPVIVEETGHTVWALGTSVITQVADLLTPYPFTLAQALFYVDGEENHGFIAPDYGDMYDFLNAESIPVVGQVEFDRLTSENPKPFVWKPGFEGEPVSPEWFKESLEDALGKMKL